MKYFLISFIFSFNLHAICNVFNSKGEATAAQDDPLYLFLIKHSVCPNNVVNFKQGLKSLGLNVEPSMVANRGRHNFESGSFSFFETVSGPNIPKGDFFFGHFTSKSQNTIFLDNQNGPGKLLIELIVWDNTKKVYNFYEMIGGAQGPKWFYRGDSLDILEDNKFVHRNVPVGEKKFGSNLRCSACHSSGGPIMKEMSAPHNDWWRSERPLPFGEDTSLSQEVSEYVTKLIDASDFSENILMGINKLERSERYQSFKRKLSLQENLRPLFCESEINLESDQISFFDHNKSILVPSSFLISSLNGNAEVSINKDEYINLLKSNKLKFPENGLIDADHGWLTPVKGVSDLLAIDSLKRNGLIDQEFITDVLAIDFKNPTISKKRCDLLKFVPENFSTNWKFEFIKNLQISNSESAMELVNNLLDGERDSLAHQLEFLSYSKNLQESFQTENYFLKLLALRKAIFQSEISKNPRGQILEPGFRVIFPE